MTTAYSSLMGLALPVQGELSGTWGDTVNNGITNYLDVALAGTQTISGSQTAVTLSLTNGNASATNIAQAGSGATGSAQYAIINCTGNPGGLLTVTVPASSRQYVVINATSTSQSVKVVGAGPTTGVTIVSGEKAHIVWNGSDFVKIASTAAGAAAGSNTQVQYNSSGSLAGSANLTFDGTTLTATGNAIISDNSSNAALRITQTGAGNALLVEDSANPDSTPFVVDASGNVIVGNTSTVTNPNPATGASTTAILQLAGVNIPTTLIGGTIYASANTTISAPYLSLGRSNTATVGSAGVVSSGDLMGGIQWHASDGTSQIRSAQIQAYVDGTPGTNDMPGRLVFSTTADGASSPTEWLRISNNGTVDLGYTGATTGQRLRVVGNLTGNTTAFGVNSAATVQSDVTSQAFYYSANLSTAAASFSIVNLIGYRANQGTIGAGSSVTSQIGFFADSTITGATNNYGFYSNIASGTGRWNFYANGTADNYFAGNVGIGVAPVANNGILQLGSYGSVQALMEKATVSATAATGTVNFDAATQAVLYYTSNAAANWTINIRGSASLSLNSMMQTGQSLTMAFMVTQGATAYYQSALTIDGASVTPKWQGGTAPTSGNASSIDAYVLTVIKTGSATFTVLASQTKFA